MSEMMWILLFRVLIALVVALGGILAIYFGYRLYLNGVGSTSDGSSVEVKNIKIHMKTIGSVLMTTSVAWGYICYLIATPTISKTGNDFVIDKLTSQVDSLSYVNDMNNSVLNAVIEQNPDVIQLYENKIQEYQQINPNKVRVATVDVDRNRR
jgi:hypothetical protein